MTFSSHKAQLTVQFIYRLICMISNGGHLLIMYGHYYYGFTIIKFFGPAPHFIVASTAYA